jgi:rubrerythrin
MRTETPATPDSQLYRCEDCGTTYRSETMDTCPHCNTPVQTTPTERELGFI